MILPATLVCSWNSEGVGPQEFLSIGSLLEIVVTANQGPCPTSFVFSSQAPRTVSLLVPACHGSITPVPWGQQLIKSEGLFAAHLLSFLILTEQICCF